MLKNLSTWSRRSGQPPGLSLYQQCWIRFNSDKTAISNQTPMEGILFNKYLKI